MARKKQARSEQTTPPSSTDEAHTVQSGALSVYSLVLPDGKVPFADWLNGLRDRAAQARVVLRVRRVATTGNFGDCQPVGEGVWELRVDYGPGYRVYYGRVEEQIVILLAGGDKPSQQSDIDVAKCESTVAILQGSPERETR
jgi:putative addiction module killer protein